MVELTDRPIYIPNLNLTSDSMAFVWGSTGLAGLADLRFNGFSDTDFMGNIILNYLCLKLHYLYNIFYVHFHFYVLGSSIAVYRKAGKRAGLCLRLQRGHQHYVRVKLATISSAL